MNQSSPLEGTTVIEIGCGTAAAVAGRHLVMLGGSVTHYCLDAPCDLADGDIPTDWMLGKQLATGDLEHCRALSTARDAAILDIATKESLVTALNDCSRVVVIVGNEEERSSLSGQGLLAEATTGLAGDIGFADTGPLPLGFAFGEIAVAVHCVGAVIEGLMFVDASEHGRSTTTVSWISCCIASLDTPIQDIGFGRDVGTYSGPHRRGLLPYGLFHGPDAYLGLAGSWETLVEEMGRKEFEGEEYSTANGRVARRDKIVSAIEEWLMTFSSVDDAVASIGTRGISARAARLADVWARAEPALWEDELGVRTVASPYLTTTHDAQLERDG